MRRLALLLCALAAVGLVVGPAQAEQAGSSPPRTTAGLLDTGHQHTCAVLLGGVLRCWGAGTHGELGYGNTATVGDDETPAAAGPVNLGTGRTAIAVAAGGAHTCAILDDHRVRCWGAGASGRLGYGDTISIGDDELAGSVGTVSLGTGRTAVAISAGAAHTCAILDTGAVSCWGLGTFGQLGYVSTASVGDDETPDVASTVQLGISRTAVAITTGQSHTCAILDNGIVSCWGLGTAGRLGYGNTNSIGDDEAPAFAGGLALGSGRTATAISAGDDHTCAILDNGWVVCWGMNDVGQLGYPGSLFVGDNEYPETMGQVFLGVGRTAVAISAGGDHTCAILDDGSVRCWGDGSTGALGYGDTHTIGDNEPPGSVGPVDLGPGRTAKAISTSTYHTCAVLDDGSVRCWGSGAQGLLGSGSAATIGDDEAPAAAAPVALGLRLLPHADLSLAATTSTPTATTGDAVTFTLTLRNDGPDPAQAPTVTVGVAGARTDVSATPGAGSFDAISGVWSPGPLAYLHEATLTVVVRPSAAGEVTLTGEVTGAPTFDPDSTPGNGLPAEDDRAGTGVVASDPPAPPAAAPAPETTSPPAAGQAAPAATRVQPGRLTLELVRPQRGVPAGTLLARGTLDVPAGASCAGRVTVTARTATRIVLTRSTRLHLSRGACRYATSFGLGGQRVAPTATVSASFAGNATLLPITSRTRTLRIG